MRKASILLSPLFLFLLLASPTSADFTVLRNVREEITTFSDQTVKYGRMEEVRIQPEKVRLTNVTHGQALIVRLDQKKVVHLDLLRRTVSELGFDALARRRGAAMAGIRGAHARIDPKPEADRLAGVLRGFGVFVDGPPKVDRRATEEKAVIAGREAARTQITVNGEPTADVWTDGEVEGAWYLEALLALQAFPPEAADALRQVRGFPLRADLRYALFLDRVHAIAETRSLDTSPIPPEEFEAPAGFKTVPFTLLPEETGQELPPAPPGK